MQIYKSINLAYWIGIMYFIHYNHADLQFKYKLFTALTTILFMVIFNDAKS